MSLHFLFPDFCYSLLCVLMRALRASNVREENGENDAGLRSPDLVPKRDTPERDLINKRVASPRETIEKLVQYAIDARYLLIDHHQSTRK